MERIGQIICARFLILSKLTFNVPSTFEAKILIRLKNITQLVVLVLLRQEEKPSSQHSLTQPQEAQKEKQ
jgi:hypothetical protein